MHEAVSRGNQRMLRALLDAGGDPLRKDVEGTTPPEIAVAKRMKRLIALFR